MAGLNYFTQQGANSVKSMSFYRMSDAPPDWAQEDASQPDYIANKEMAEKLRPIYVNGEQLLNDTHESGAVNFVSGKNVTLTTQGNSIIISAKGTGGEGGGCDCPELVEGEGIDIIDDEIRGQKIISLEPGSISDDYIESVSWSKLVQDESTTIILNGGKAK